MRITVFGASGKVGRLVVWEILRRGHQVHAFVHSRNPFEDQEEVTVVKGEVADTAAVHAALADSDAVISTLGGWGKTSSDVLATGMTTIIPAMQAQHLTRIVTLTGAGARWAGDRSSLRLAVNRTALIMMKAPALRDAEKHLDIRPKLTGLDECSRARHQRRGTRRIPPRYETAVVADKDPRPGGRQEPDRPS